MPNNLNVVVVISHDMGQHMGCYGSPDVRTPNFDAFAAAGLRFENNFCTAPQCSPSRAALWTGRYPHTNGVVGLAHAGFQNELNDGERHLAAILGDAGYDTHLFNFQHVTATNERCGFAQVHRAEKGVCSSVASAVSDFLASRPEGASPLFLQASFIEPHRSFAHDDVEALDPETLTVPPYLPDIPIVREDLAELEASCSSADKAFGAIVEAIDAAGMAHDTIVVFTVDHGIAFPHAKMTLYDPGIETALLMRVPGTAGGKVHDEMISNVDFSPTLLDLLEMEVPENMQGRSFKGLIKGTAYEPRGAVFAEKTYHTYYDPMRCIRTAKWKLIANFENAPRQETSPDYPNNARSYVEVALALPGTMTYHPPIELYDLEEDPWEQDDLAAKPEYADIRDDLGRKLRTWMIETADPLLDGPISQAAYRNRMAAFKAV